MSVQERRSREREERIESILNAALQVFAKEGLQQATVDAIAAEAQLSKGAIYYYFPSKEALLESLMARVSSEYFRGLLMGSAGQDTPKAICQNTMSALLDHYVREPELFNFIYMVLGETEPRPVDALRAFVIAHQAWLKDLQSAISEVLEEYSIPIEPFINLVGTYAHGLLFEVVSGRPPEHLKEESIKCFDFLLDSGFTSAGVRGSKTPKED